MKPYFTEDQYRYARDEASALEYARSHGYALVQDGHYHRLKEHPSMVFTPDGRWFWNSRSLEGRVIEFVMAYEGKTLPEAVLSICGAEGQTYKDVVTGKAPAAPQPRTQPAPPSEQKREFELPPKSPSMKRLFAYLCQTRKLDRDIVTAIVHAGDLYESVRQYGGGKEAHNAVFVGRDLDGIPRSAFQRGLSSFPGSSAFKRDVAGSDPAWPFVLFGRPGVTTVMVFEAAIDAISHASLVKASGRNYPACHRIALGGTQKWIGLLNFLKYHPEITHVVLAPDADDAGRKAATKLIELIPEGEYTVSTIFPPHGKDWNEYLQMRAKLSAEVEFEM